MIHVIHVIITHSSGSLPQFRELPSSRVTLYPTLDQWSISSDISSGNVVEEDVVTFFSNHPQTIPDEEGDSAWMAGQIRMLDLSDRYTDTWRTVNLNASAGRMLYMGDRRHHRSLTDSMTVIAQIYDDLSTLSSGHGPLASPSFVFMAPIPIHGTQS